MLASRNTDKLCNSATWLWCHSFLSGKAHEKQQKRGLKWHNGAGFSSAPIGIINKEEGISRSVGRPASKSSCQHSSHFFIGADSQLFHHHSCKERYFPRDHSLAPHGHIISESSDIFP
jgi:hypothetical protein